MEQVSVVTTGNDCKKLPPGFRFHPTDEEIITHYLSEKVLNSNFSPRAIAHVDLNRCEPWDLPDKAKMGEKEWYFFCRRDRKYPTGMRTNRATEAGYWKATGKDKEIYKGKGCLVGMKKTLVFYKGRAPKGEKTNWVMHEYRLEGKFSHQSLSIASKLQDEWVVCRVFHKASGIKKNSFSGLLIKNSAGNHDALDFKSLPPLLDPQYSDGNGPSSNFINSNHHDLQNQKSFPSNIYSYMTHQHNQNNPPINSTLFSQILPPNPMIPAPRSSNLGYLANSIQSFPSSSFNGTDLKDLAVTQEASSGPKDCKVEQFSNQSMASQETGLTIDVNTEISSIISKHKMGYADLQYPSDGGPVDWDCLWNY